MTKVPSVFRVLVYEIMFIKFGVLNSYFEENYFVEIYSKRFFSFCGKNNVKVWKIE